MYIQSGFLILFASSLLIMMFQAQFFWQKKLTYQFEAGFHKVAGNTRKIEKAG